MNNSFSSYSHFSKESCRYTSQCFHLKARLKKRG
nr:MAG TPA: hypothetical protein [Caudoviricetes sp.]